MTEQQMKDVQKGFRKIVYLTFTPDISGRPVVCNLARLFDLSFNILKSEITPRQEGNMTLEISGMEDAYNQGINYLKENGVKITPVAQRISRDEDTCIHCGMCTAMCPTGALCLNKADRTVEFDVEKCSACGMCTRVCPVRAMNVDLGDNSPDQ